MRFLRTSAAARLRLIAAAILVIGLSGAAAIYLSAGSGGVDYEPEETKQYLRTLQLYGGTANVLATELRQWFVSIWHGERLAFTVGFITLVTAFVCWFFSYALEPPPSDHEPPG